MEPERRGEKAQRGWRDQFGFIRRFEPGEGVRDGWAAHRKAEHGEMDCRPHMWKMLERRSRDLGVEVDPRCGRGESLVLHRLTP